jgi:hypothetical protein
VSKAKPRKPRPLVIKGYSKVEVTLSKADDIAGIRTFHLAFNDAYTSFTSRDARQFSDWLIRFADWAEWKESR